MPLQKLLLKPGVNKESTTLANEGTWFEMDKVRFRSGYPEKIGGWARLSADKFLGVCRSLFNWVTLGGANLMGVGTNIKFYIENGGSYYDITPLRATVTINNNPFVATNGSAVLTVTDTAHGGLTGDFVTFSGATGLGGNITAAVLNSEYKITVVDADTYTITAAVTANATDAAGSPGGGAAVVAAYQISVGTEISTPLSGWGAGAWGAGPWGVGTSSLNLLRLWSQDAYGENLLINPRGGALYLWIPNASPVIYARAGLLSPTSTGVYQTDADCPTLCNAIAVSDSSRFTLAFGCNDYGSNILDPLLVRWSDQENYAVWTPAITNQAGSFRLSTGSAIIAHQQTRQEILVWTDAAVYSMQYLGPPYVWGFQILGDNISIAGPNATITAANITYWMGLDKFYTYSGRVETLYCPLRQYIFGDINLEQQPQFFAGTNEGFNEVWWFYCSANSNTVDRYVIYNYLEQVWSYGNLARTAWLDTPLRNYPTAADYNRQLVYHEQGVDDASVFPPAPISAYCQSADFNIGDGHNFGFAWRMIPDVTFNGSTANNPSVTMTLKPRQNPGANYSAAAVPSVTSTQNYQAQRNYEVQQFTEIVYVRVRGRQMAFRISSEGLGVQWQLGVPSLDLRPDGRR
jgi:hypothetical protein